MQLVSLKTKSALAFAVMKYQASPLTNDKIVLNTQRDEWGIVVKDDEVEISERIYAVVHATSS